MKECTCGLEGYFRFTSCCGYSVIACRCSRHEMGNCITCGGKPTEEQRKRYYQYA